MKKSLTKIAAFATAAICFCSAFLFVACKKTDKGDLSAEDAYALAVKDAVFAEEADIRPLVNLVKGDENVTWDGERVLVAFMHKYPSSYPDGEDITLKWGNVWCVSEAEFVEWVKTNADDIIDPIERLHQVMGMPFTKNYDTVTALWVEADLVFRPAYEPVATKPMTTTLQKTGDEAFDVAFKEWFDGNIIWSYFDSAFPWTRLGYTYDWGAKGDDKYGLSEFIVFSGASATVGYTCTVEEFVERALCS